MTPTWETYSGTDLGRAHGRWLDWKSHGQPVSATHQPLSNGAKFRYFPTLQMINSRVNLPRPQGELLVVETSWSVHRPECRKVAPSDMAICQTLQGERHNRLRRDWAQEIRRTVPKLYIPSIDFFRSGSPITDFIESASRRTQPGYVFMKFGNVFSISRPVHPQAPGALWRRPGKVRTSSLSRRVLRHTGRNR